MIRREKMEEDINQDIPVSYDGEQNKEWVKWCPKEQKSGRLMGSIINNNDSSF